MQVIKFPSKKDYAQLLKRPLHDYRAVRETVQAILDNVRIHGDAAVKQYTQQFDRISLHDFELQASEWDAADSIDESLKKAIDVAIKNISMFHRSQFENVTKVDTMPGITCWRKSVPIEKVGLYIPGGTAPLFSTVLMLAVPARIAGCNEIIVCTPPQTDGNVHPAILYAARQTGVRKIFKIGGAQAIAAMAFGTQTIPKVHKIFGPGNQYITCAKMLVAAEGVAIDMPAGPSEVAILADETCDPEYVAADLLAQAEHGKDSQVLLVSTDERVIDQTKDSLQRQFSQLPRWEIVEAAVKNSKAILVQTLDDALELINQYAPEHLIIACRDAEAIAENVRSAGSVFLGNYSSESVGDYASGTNHTLPTNGFAAAYSGVSLDSFFKKITFQQVTKEGLSNIAETVQVMAEAEGLRAHANAVSIRLKN